MELSTNEFVTLVRLMFQALKGMAATFRVTSSRIIRTAAERRLPNTDSVLMMLKWLERHLSHREPGSEDATR
jgi:trehalose 6-phosphate synthase/phosphatase